MYRENVVCAVVPAYNERRQIAAVLRSMPEYVDHVVVVDDASTDETARVVTRIAREDQRVVLLRHDSNQGVGGAIATGYKWARDNGAAAAVVLAGDGQMDPDDVPSLLDPLVDDDVDYSKANRLIHQNAHRTIPFVRLFGNAVLSLLTKIASGYWHVADSQTGFTAIRRRALAVIDWDRMYKRYGQPNDLLVTLNIHGFRVRDVPMKPVYDVGERSKMPYHVIFTISFLLWKGFLRRLLVKYVVHDFHPLVFFYLLGAAMMASNALLFIRLIVLWRDHGHAPELTGLAWMFSMTLGLICLFFGMWLDMEANRDLK